MKGPEVASQSEAPAQESFGPEYDKVFALRTNLGNLKKAIDALSPPLEAILRTRTALQGATEGDAAHAKHKAALEKEVQKRDDAIAKLREFEVFFVDAGEYDKRPIIREIADGALVERNSPEELSDFLLANKRHSQKIFNEQKALLQKLKDLKKQ